MQFSYSFLRTLNDFRGKYTGGNKNGNDHAQLNILISADMVYIQY